MAAGRGRRGVAATVRSWRGDYRFAFAALILGAISFSLLQSLIAPALPTIARELHTTQGAVTWLMTGYLLTCSIATPILGRIGDAVGKERMFMVTLVALGVGCGISALSTSMPLMLTGRLVQGIGGGMMALAFGIVRDRFPAHKVPGAIGMITALTGVGGGLGIVISGPISTHLGYHWFFWAPMILIGTAGVIAYFLMPNGQGRNAVRIGWAGGVVLSAWLVALLLGVSEGSRWGWTSPVALGLIGTAVVLVVVWVVVEQRSAAPLVDMRIMRVPAVRATNATAMLFGAVMYAPMTFLPAFVQTDSHVGYGFSATVTQSGLFMLPATLMMFVTGVTAGWVASTLGSKFSVVLGGILSTASFVSMALVHAHPWQIYLGTTLMGLGIGFAYSAMSNLIVHAVPLEHTGVASGMNANIRTIGGSIGSQVAASLVVAGVAGGALPSESGYTHAFLFLAGLAAVSVVCAVAIPAPRTLRDPSPITTPAPRPGALAAPAIAPSAGPGELAESLFQLGQ